MAGEWHLDKKVSVAVIITLVLNMSATVYSAGRIVAMVEQNAAAILENKSRLASHAIDCDSKRSATTSRVNSLESIVARIDERTKFTQEDIGEIKDLLKTK